MDFNKIGNPAIKAINNKSESEEETNRQLKSNSEEIQSSEEIQLGSNNSKKDQVVENNISIFNIFQIILCVIILAIVLVVVLLSGSIAVSGWSMDGDPGTIAKIIIFIFASSLWFLYLPYYYLYVVWFKGMYYTSNIYPLPSWLG